MAHVPFSVVLGCWLAFLGSFVMRLMNLLEGIVGSVFIILLYRFEACHRFLCMPLEFFVVHPLDGGFAAWQRLLE